MKLANFQLKAIKELMENMEHEKEIILKSPTGSGKTIILTQFMDEYGKGHFNNVFIWLTPGKGDLEEQSKEKMDRYINNSQTKLLADVMTSGFKENDACFINWEKLTKKDNNALKESEKLNFQEHVSKAHDKGLEFIIIVDESHHNNTVKADDIINLFKPKKIIRTSATPNEHANAKLIPVKEDDVVAEGLIKKMVVINENFGHSLEVDDSVGFLLDKALDKQRDLKQAFEEQDSKVNPMIIIQLPNNSDVLINEVENYLRSKNVTYENGLLAVWLDKKKQNLEEIEKLDSKPIAIIIKQAVATGWDCPRAHILVKLRENTSETFEIQTIGRIRRMPEAKHYGSDLLDSCYLYTFDEKFTEGVKSHLGKGALSAMQLFLKKEHRDITLISEQKTSLAISNDATQILKVMVSFYEREYGTTTRTTENKTRLERKGYTFSDMIVNKTRTGEVYSFTNSEFDALQSVKLTETLNTTKHGREYHNRVSLLGLKLNLQYEQINTIMRRLFDKNVNYNRKILRLETREVYAFIINNFNKLKEDIESAMTRMDLQETLDIKEVIEVPFRIPKEFLFTYNKENRVQLEYESNVYSGYLSSAEIRSDSEKSFEKYCNEAKSIEWIYKNGDKGNEYFSLVYLDNFGNQKHFYPDYILSKEGEIWIIETKGGFSRSKQSEDIDKFSPKKFEVLERYLKKHNLKGGFVRKDKSNNELFICMEEYSDDISSDNWVLLKDVLP